MSDTKVLLSEHQWTAAMGSGFQLDKLIKNVLASHKALVRQLPIQDECEPELKAV